ncbi:MAG: hypothetical protein KY394_05575, partial [Actinobacteria bacterium]|nr:hypothetical protein [Actinomycetota bacterium]
MEEMFRTMSKSSVSTDRSKARSGSLVRRIGLGAFSLTLILGVLTLTAGYLHERSVLIGESTERIEAVAEVQKARLEAYVEGTQQSVALIASRTRFRSALNEYAQSSDPELVGEMEKTLSDAVAADDRVVLIEVLDLQGEVVVS